MTPPGGSRDDDDGAPGDDPKLRAMRAVWLEMREEDPPDRGLTDLLAAARSKAEAMQPGPGAWQRLLAALRRPPVLALATVTVLVAGAVLIGRRMPHEAGRGLTTSPEPAGPARPAAIDHGAGSSGGFGAGPAAAEMRHTEQAAADPGGAPAAPAPQPAAPPPPPTARPPERSVRPAPPAHTATTPLRRSSPSGEAPRHGDDHTATRASPSAQAALAPEPAPPPPERATQLGASAAVPSADTAGDLYRQCEAAAQRGDCPAVRRLVDRISRIDRGYRVRLAKDSPVGKCLAE